MTFEHLFLPGRIGKMGLKNRMIMSPMVTQLSVAGEITERLIKYYAERARGGVALIVVEAAFPRQGGQPGRLSIYDDKFVPGFRSLIEAVHREGPKIALQINPSRGRSDRVDAVSASGVPHPVTGVRPRALSVGEIQGIEEEFGKGVERAKEAGADAVMIHGGNGYLISEFLSLTTNKRQDEYGGDLRSRARLATELLDIAKERTGATFPILFRLMADERIDGGFSLEDAIQVCKLLQDHAVDAIDIVSGAMESMEWINPSMYLPLGYNVGLAEAIKKEVRVPVSVAGRINNPILADEIIKEGKADFVTIGKALIADPEFPKKAAEGRVDDIRPCIGCLRCWQINRLNLPLACSLNPDAGKEGEPLSRPPRKRKKVLVVGGGPAGMQAALTAATRGHQVTLWESGKTVGGQLNLASLPPHKGEIANVVQFLGNQLRKLGVEVKLNKRASPQSILDFGADTVILATGSLPIVPRVPGLKKNRHVLSDREALSQQIEKGKKVVVIGGGLVGCETAEALAPMAGEVTIVEVLDEIAADTVPQMRKLLLRRLQEKKVCIFCGVLKEEVTETGVIIQDRQGARHVLEADLIVIAVGSTSDSSLASELQNKGLELYCVGDCREPGKILEAIHDGHRVGREV